MKNEQLPPLDSFLFVGTDGKLWDFMDCGDFISIAPVLAVQSCGLVFGQDKTFDRRDFDGSVNGFI